MPCLLQLNVSSVRCPDNASSILIGYGLQQLSIVTWSLLLQKIDDRCCNCNKPLAFNSKGALGSQTRHWWVNSCLNLAPFFSIRCILTVVRQRLRSEDSPSYTMLDQCSFVYGLIEPLFLAMTHGSQQQYPQSSTVRQNIRMLLHLADQGEFTDREGGQGCRDKKRLDRRDRAKYRGTKAKSVSKKAFRVGEEGARRRKPSSS